MHTWKPDAYGEAPGVVGTLLAGGVTSCAFLAILRVYQICAAAGEAAFARGCCSFMGLFSMAVAAVFMVRQRDFKRMLAYSSVEHMGILVLGIGIGGAGRLRRAAPPGQQRPDQGRALPLGGQHPPRLRQQAHRRGAGALRRCRSPGPCSWRVSWRSPARRRSARSSASSRSLTPPSARAILAAGLFLLFCWSWSSSAWARRCWRRPGRGPARAGTRHAYRDSLLHGRADRRVCMALVLLLGLYIPAAAGRR